MAYSAAVGGPGPGGPRIDARGHVDPYPLVVRPLAAAPPAAPLVDLRDAWHERRAGSTVAPGEGPWERALVGLRRFAGGGRGGLEVIKPFDRRRGAGSAQLERALAALDGGRAVACFAWWPSEVAASTTDILGVDALEVPPPDRKGGVLVDGHAVVLVGYGRHDAFPGGGYVIVHNDWSDWGDEGHGYVPFTFLRAYAIEMCTTSADGEPGRPDRVDRVDRAGRVDAVDAVDRAIQRQARCRDERGSLTSLFFSEDLLDLARARAICSVCAVRRPCLARALERREPYGVWGGEVLIDGRVADKRGRGRPPRVPRPRLVVDEITGEVVGTDDRGSKLTA